MSASIRRLLGVSDCWKTAVQTLSQERGIEVFVANVGKEMIIECGGEGAIRHESCSIHDSRLESARVCRWSMALKRS